MTGSQTDNYGNYQPNFGPAPIDNTPTSNAGGVIVASGNPNTLGVLALPGSLFLDQATLTLYGTMDGTTWSAVSGGGGGATQIFSGNYAGGNPTQTPTTLAAAAVDTSNGRIWWYYSGQWN